MPAERQLDHRERRARDRADAGGEPVEPVEEVDHVHHGDDPDHGQWDADPGGHLVDADDREREPLHPDAEPGGDRRGEHLAAELLPPEESAEVVDRADHRRDARAEQHAAQLAAERQEGERRHEDAEEERESAEPRDLVPRALAFRRAVDEAQVTRRAADGRRQHEDDHERASAPQRTSGWSVSCSQTISRLLRAVEPVSRVAETGNDVAALVQLTVDRRDDDLHVGVRRPGCSRSPPARR